MAESDPFLLPGIQIEYGSRCAIRRLLVIHRQGDRRRIQLWPPCSLIGRGRKVMEDGVAAVVYHGQHRSSITLIFAWTLEGIEMGENRSWMMQGTPPIPKISLRVLESIETAF